MRFRPPLPLGLLLALLGLLLAAPAGRADPERPAEPSWSSDQTDALVALVKEYSVLEDFETSKKDELILRAEKIGPVPAKPMKKLVKKLLRAARSAGPRLSGKSDQNSRYSKFPGRFYLSGAGGGRKGVFFGLHGGEAGIGDGRSAQGQWGAATGKGLIGVFPTANLPDMPYTWQHRDVESCVLAILKELKRTYRIDANRVYIAGHSLGGSGSFHIGPRNADLFAGVSPNAGGCHGVTLGTKTELPGGFLANLYNTPIFITHFAGDPRVRSTDSQQAGRDLARLKEEHPGGYEHRCVIGEGVSHGFPPKTGTSKIISWLTKSKRDPYPKKFVWEPSTPRKRLFFWLRKSRPPSGTRGGNRIVATIGKNRVEIETNSVRGLSVMLADQMFDAEKPVTVVVKGKVVFEDYVQRTPAALLESIAENIDETQVFTYRIDL